MPDNADIGSVAVVGQDKAGQRLDKFLLDAFSRENGLDGQTGISRAGLQKAIQSGHCLVDGKPVTRPARKLLPGQKVSLALPQAESSLEPDFADQREIAILWQDQDLLVCNKPAGLTVHPCPSCSETTLVNLLLARFPALAGLEGLRPGIVHRLDRDTSGLLLVALTERARLALATAFAERMVHKQYLALASGLVPDGESHAPLGRDQATRVKRAIIPENQGGKPAHTAWQRLWSCEGAKKAGSTPGPKAAKKARAGARGSTNAGGRSGGKPAADRGFSLLGVRIFTGRTHQIRVHLASQGHPLLGDRLYAPHALRELAPRQMLHAWKLAFEHPITGQAMCFCCPPPPDFAATAVRLARRMQRLVVTGNPGSGKSAFCKQLADLGLATISADAIVAGLYARDGEVTAWLCQHYGHELAGADGGIDKTRLMAILQADQLARREIESLVHALVRQEVEDFFARQEKSGAELAVAEIPLYLECQWQESLTPRPLSLCVWCPQQERHARISKNRGWETGKIAAIDSWQWPDERKRKACDLVVENTGTVAELASEAARIVEELARRREAETRRLAKELDKIWNGKS